jgi:hypothetical protein
MTFREIIEREDQNTDSIWLYREGLFMKAYERSAFFAHTLIHEFKLSKRYIKTVNMDVISLGFPEQAIPNGSTDMYMSGCRMDFYVVICERHLTRLSFITGRRL